jgi:hypothetical protein
MVFTAEDSKVELKRRKLLVELDSKSQMMKSRS